MSVYAIAQLWIHDPVIYGRYVARFMDVFKNYKGRVLVADESPIMIEGKWDGHKVVVVSFPDEVSFREWAESPEYLEIAKDRKAGANSVIVLVKGIEKVNLGAEYDQGVMHGHRDAGRTPY
jgi:uncharacterized protein (DUF1330 family)